MSSTFGYDNLQLATNQLAVDGTLEISFDLTNTGKYEGTEVVQLYVQDKAGSITRPVKELKRLQADSSEAG